MPFNDAYSNERFLFYMDVNVNATSCKYTNNKHLQLHVSPFSIIRFLIEITKENDQKKNEAYTPHNYAISLDIIRTAVACECLA